MKGEKQFWVSKDIPLTEVMVLLMDGVREAPSVSSDSRLIQVTRFLRYGCSIFRACLAKSADIDAEQNNQ